MAELTQDEFERLKRIYQAKWNWTSVEEFREKLLGWIYNPPKPYTSNPIAFAKGFTQTSWILKSYSPEKYAAAIEVLEEVLGKERLQLILAEERPANTDE